MQARVSQRWPPDTDHLHLRALQSLPNTQVPEPRPIGLESRQETPEICILNKHLPKPPTLFENLANCRLTG